MTLEPPSDEHWELVWHDAYDVWIEADVDLRTAALAWAARFIEEGPSFAGGTQLLGLEGP